MSHRIATNFSPGPAALPERVITQLQQELPNFREAGFSIMETSHRSARYQELHNAVLEKIRQLLQVPPTHHILLLAGGATLQFAMLPYNLGREGAYIVAGQWGKKAYEAAQQLGGGRKLYDGALEHWQHLPDWDSLECRSSDSYLHFTTNETINGLQWHHWPEERALPPLIADMSSDIASRPLPLARLALIYASAQKNLGIAGVTLVILNSELLPQAVSLPPYLDYHQHIKSNSLYNTPTTIATYTLGLMLDWIKECGALPAMQERSRRRAATLYDCIDQYSDFYHNSIPSIFRSRMNVIFTLPSQRLTEQFLQAAEEEQFIGLAGHRSVGGCRVSLYNAIEQSAVETLVTFMRHFAQRWG